MQLANLETAAGARREPEASFHRWLFLPLFLSSGFDCPPTP